MTCIQYIQYKYNIIQVTNGVGTTQQLKPITAGPFNIHGQTDLRLEIMKYIAYLLLVIRRSRVQDPAAADNTFCLRWAVWKLYNIIEHFHLNILQSVQLHN
jgi:hypothetical protein